MNHIKTFLLITLLSLIVISCTEVVDIDLETAQERLVIEASINWEKGTLGNEQVIKLTKTASFYDNEVVYATGASVSIVDANNVTYTFDETSDGIYTTSLFNPEFALDYTLNITYNDEVFTATEQLISTSTIDLLAQSTELGFSDDPEITMFFTDPEETDNYYKTLMIHKRTEDFEQFYFNDQYWEGNQAMFWFESEDLEVGDEIDCYVFGISQRYQKYGEKVFTLAGNRGGPFTTPPINIKGNCVNSTKSENYPYGYFTMSEFSKETYIFE
ncbi:MAG TPA: DUF4249 domain-containing protein [Lutibacter sp.]|nr:DUF4249 domain-containing protein [Lutibacter sp.]